jgi:CPA2 family monovalent cation:H+ antiporter-2
VAPLIIFVPALAQSAGLGQALLLASLKAVLALILILALGQKLMRPWFHLAARAKSGELFMLNVLLVTLGLAYLTDQAGLSLALGAFLAGVLIAETEYRYQVEADIRPFRDVLMGLFFVSVGFMLDLNVVAANWGQVLAILVALMLGKFLVIALLAGLFTQSWAVVTRVGAGLAQAGEFGFVCWPWPWATICWAASNTRRCWPPWCCPCWLRPCCSWPACALPRLLEGGAWMQQARGVHEIATRAFGIQKHVILCGYGRSGQSLARLLESEHGFPSSPWTTTRCACARLPRPATRWCSGIRPGTRC